MTRLATHCGSYTLSLSPQCGFTPIRFLLQFKLPVEDLSVISEGTPLTAIVRTLTRVSAISN